MIDIRAVARALGGDVIGRDAVAAPGPGHSPRDRSLTVKFAARAPEGFLVYSHCDDDWRDCRDHVRARLGLPPWQPGDGQDRRVDPSRLKSFERAAVEAEVERRPLTQDDHVRIERARAVWDEATDPRGTLAERYLRSRALALDDDVAGKVLRYHPNCPWRDENTGTTVGVPALVAVFRSVDDDAVTAIHRVALTAEGAKIGRRMLGIVHRAAVKLDQAGDMLHVGEGIETMMAARQLGLAPAWALGSAGMVAHFPVTSTGHLRICGERDEASARAVGLCTRRWQAAGRQVQVVLPTVGKDLNDELQHGDHQSRAGR
jgi:Toprim domain